MPEFHFPGFASPSYTQVPDELFDVLLPHLGEKELKVLLYIIRRTFGFKKDEDAISFSQFLEGITTRDGRQLDAGCGVKSRGHLSTALKNLAALGVITADKRMDEKSRRLTTTYSLRFRQFSTVVPNGNYGSSQPEPPGRSQRAPWVDPDGNQQQTDQQQTDPQSATPAQPITKGTAPYTKKRERDLAGRYRNLVER
jgi:hypothetical protein